MLEPLNGVYMLFSFTIVGGNSVTAFVIDT